MELSVQRSAFCVWRSGGLCVFFSFFSVIPPPPSLFRRPFHFSSSFRHPPRHFEGGTTEKSPAIDDRAPFLLKRQDDVGEIPLSCLLRDDVGVCGRGRPACRTGRQIRNLKSKIYNHKSKVTGVERLAFGVRAGLGSCLLFFLRHFEGGTTEKSPLMNSELPFAKEAGRCRRDSSVVPPSE